MAGGAGGYLYVQKLQSDLKLSEANNAKLEGGIQDQQAVIKQIHNLKKPLRKHPIVQKMVKMNEFHQSVKVLFLDYDQGYPGLAVKAL